MPALAVMTEFVGSKNWLYIVVVKDKDMVVVIAIDIIIMMEKVSVVATESSD